MPELRWALLILGVVFIAVLAWWERRKPHQASRQSPEARPGSGGEGGWGPEQSWSGDPWGQDQEPATRRSLRDPTLVLPEMRARDPAPLPVVQMAEDEAEPAAGFAAEAAMAPAEELPRIEPPPELESAPEPEPEPEPESEPGLELASTPVPEPIVEWPPDNQRTLVALRLVAPSQERFAGRAVRQALTAEGFVPGKFTIFHKPDAHNRAVLSAASLSNPGTFDPQTMDSQRFAGISLFAVLPGPKPPLKAFEELLITARALNERLQGALQDERGGPLTPMRIEALRDALEPRS